MSLGARMKQLRTERMMKQSELAEVLGMTVATISAYENETRTPDINTTAKIANYFNVTIDNLIGRKVESDSDLKDIIRNQTLSYKGEHLSEHDIKVIEGFLDAVLNKEN
ncbi:helix-turn-helix domain-containing protein [Globicatella sanguinis]